MDISYKNSKEVDKMWARIALRKVKFELSSLLMKKILAVFVILDFNTSCCISLSAATPLFEYMAITGHSEVVEIFNRFDEDKMGSIDFPEFIDLLFFLESKNQEDKDQPQITLNHGETKENTK